MKRLLSLLRHCHGSLLLVRRLRAARRRRVAVMAQYSGDTRREQVLAARANPIRSNVAQLRVEWRRPALDAAVHRGGAARARDGQPARHALDGGRRAVTRRTPIGFVEAFDAGTGRDTARWSRRSTASLHELPRRRRRAASLIGRAATASDSSYSTASTCSRSTRRRASRSRGSFGDNGHVNVSADIGGGFVYVATRRAVRRSSTSSCSAEHLATSSLTRKRRAATCSRRAHGQGVRWVFHVVPQAGELGVETWENANRGATRATHRCGRA